MTIADRVPRVTIYLPDFSGGGAERLHLRMSRKFVEAGLSVTFLVDRLSGELLIPARQLNIPIISFSARRQVDAFPKLLRYLRKAAPDVLIANTEHMNLSAIIAARVSGGETKIISCQHNTLSEQARRPSWKYRVLPILSRMILPFADAHVAVSAGVADDLSANLRIARQRIQVIYNGVVTDDFEQRASADPAHPFFKDGNRVLIAMGRMVAQKDFETLIRSFSLVHKRDQSTRLLLLGDGPLRASLEKQVVSLDLQHQIAFLGFQEEALGYLRKSNLFVLTSKFEGFGNVIAEALACGTPVVSTDCPHGPAEILEGGKYGALVPIGDVEKLADEILVSLGAPASISSLRLRGKEFTVKACADKYVDLIKSLT